MKRKSKAIGWYNITIGVLALIESSAHLLQPLLPANVYQILIFTLVVGVGALNLIMKETS